MNPYDIIEKYYSPKEDIYKILVKHSESVAQKALAIARNHPAYNLDETFLYQAAMLHDIGIYKTNAPSIACYGVYPYVCHGFLGSAILYQEGYPSHALVCERHTGTGISLFEIKERHLPIPQRDMRPVSIEEQVVCFADLFFSKTHIDKEFTLSEIQNKLSKHGQNSIDQFNKWCALFL